MERTVASLEAHAAACPLRLLGGDVSSAMLVVQNMIMKADNKTFFTRFPLVKRGNPSLVLSHIRHYLTIEGCLLLSLYDLKFEMGLKSVDTGPALYPGIQKQD